MTTQKLLVPTFLMLGIGAALLREILFARYYGTSFEMEVFRLAFSIPNLLSQSIAPAFLGAAIPLLVAAEDARREQGGLIIRRIIHVNLFGSALIAGAGLLFAKSMASVLAPGFDPGQVGYLASQIRVAWIFFLIVSLSFSLRAVLNSRDVFWPSASSALIVSATFVLACWFAAYRFETANWTSGFLLRTAISASVIVLAVHCVHRKNVVVQYLKSWRDQINADSTTYRVISSALLAVIVFKVSYAAPRIIDRAIASDLEPGLVAAIDYSFGIINVPGILFATSFITVAYPGFSRMISRQSDLASLKKYLMAFLAITGIAIIAGVLLSHFANGTVEILYQRDNFDRTATSRTSELLRWHSLGLGAMVGSLVLSQALLAFRAYWIAMGLVIIRVAAKVASVSILVPTLGITGLGMSFVIPEIVTLIAAGIAIYLLLMRYRQPQSDIR